MRKLLSLLVLGLVATALCACANCGHCIKDPPCKPKCGCP
jgi:hypothetical protein